MSTQRVLRRQYLSLHRGLTDILYRYDPLGLAATGTPRDEYEPEVSTIISRLKNANGPDDVRRIVHQEFLKWFGAEETAGPESAYDTIAQEIWHSFMKRELH
jgi:hypothetical protein